MKTCIICKENNTINNKGSYCKECKELSLKRKKIKKELIPIKNEWSEYQIKEIGIIKTFNPNYNGHLRRDERFDYFEVSYLTVITLKENHPHTLLYKKYDLLIKDIDQFSFDGYMWCSSEYYEYDSQELQLPIIKEAKKLAKTISDNFYEFDKYLKELKQVRKELSLIEDKHEKLVKEIKYIYK